MISARANAPGRLETVGPGHPQIHQHDVGLALQRGRDGEVAVAHHLDDIEVLFSIECDLHRFAEGAVIVGDDDGDRICIGPSHGTGDGRRTKACSRASR